ncbi:class A beta-lactamase-related serine hydrolase [Bibersteinia trehalosi]|uniref:Class A beta-lactamase-related serine hydrolase n=1 Tax=Bibersteinia trehalosi TaxID=47735 RepID=A0A3R8N1W2_BIBTR|nr:serine hydrolase domain-containing protein [Bibersteinia trehalosi]RRN05858.1 class A beta-lactamase-related serine hydrolase [Bibersteinia trehalosi]
MNTNQLSIVRQDIQSYIDKGLMYGANIIIAQKGQIVMRESFGTVDGSRPMTADDLFLTMSLSKSFTAVLVLNAIEKGLFSLNTPVAQLFPEFAQHDKQFISVYHLLCHQAGMYGKLIPPSPMTIEEAGDMNKWFEAICQMPARFVAGEKAGYSPIAGFTVLAKILEKTDPKQRSFAQIAIDELFAPLGMTDSRFGNAKNDPRRVAVTHTPLMSKGQSTLSSVKETQDFLNGFANEGSVIAGGNAFCTIDDVFAFAENFRLNLQGQGVRILSPAMANYATQNHCGEMLNEVEGIEIFKNSPLSKNFQARFGLHGGYARGTGHVLTMCGYLASPNAFGGMGGASTYYLIDPKRELTVAFLSAGFIEGLGHLVRVAKMNDLIIGACE